MMKSKINSIEDLHREKEKLKIKMEVAEHAFFLSLNHSRQLTKNYFLSKISLPTLALNFAAIGVDQILTEKETDSNNATGEHWTKSILPHLSTLIEFFTAA